MRQYWDWNYDRPQRFLPTWEARQMLKALLDQRSAQPYPVTTPEPE